MRLALTEPQEEFVFCPEPYPAMVAGLGCVHADTKIATEYGLMRISDIDRPMRILSWNEKDQQFQLSQGGGSFPKGKDYLYRVTTKQGEFVAAGHHRVFSSGHNYIPVRHLYNLYEQGLALPSLLRSSLEPDQLSFRANAPHCTKKDEGYLGYYADEARRYGQQLHATQDSGQASVPLLNGVRRLFHKSARLFFLRLGGSVVQKPKRTRHDLFAAQTYMLGYAPLPSALAEASGGCISSLFSERIWHYRQLFLQSLLTSVHRRIKGLFFPLSRVQNFLQACKSPVADKDIILKVSVEERKEVYYDIQVLDTNNYVCENGLIHHNSGKSQAGIVRLALKMVTEPGINTAYMMPTYDLLRLRAMPGAEEILSGIGLRFTTNRSDYTIKVHGYGDIIFRSYDRPERIIAYEVAHSIADELDTLPKEKAAFVWRKISERNRQKCIGLNTIGNVTTPDQGYSGFTYAKWEKQKQPGYHLIKAATASNPFLPDGYIEQIRANYDPLLADMYLNGEFVSLHQNKVYHFFDRNKHHISRTIQPGDRLHIGLDFNIGGCCATVCVIDDNCPVAVDEFVSHDTRDFVNNLSRYKGHGVTIYPDASGKANRTNASLSDIGIIMQAGYNVDAPDGNPPVRDRVNAVNALLAHGKLFVNTDKCPELTDALEMQGYDKKGEPEKYDEHPAIDDWTDGLGYLINRRFPINRPNSTTKFRM